MGARQDCACKVKELDRSVPSRLWTFLSQRPVTVAIKQFDLGGLDLKLTSTLEAKIEQTFHAGRSDRAGKLVADAAPADNVMALVSSLPDASGIVGKILAILPTLRFQQLELHGVLLKDPERGAGTILRLQHGNTVKAYQEIWASDYGIKPPDKPEAVPPESDYLELAGYIAIWLCGQLIRDHDTGDKEPWSVEWRDWSSYARFHAANRAYGRQDYKAARRFYEMAIRGEPRFLTARLNLEVMEMHQVFREHPSDKEHPALLQKRIDGLQEIANILGPRPCSREWFVAMYNLSAAHEYLAGDLRTTSNFDAARSAFETVSILQTVIKKYRSKGPGWPLYSYLGELETYISMQRDAYDFRREWADAHDPKLRKGGSNVRGREPAEDNNEGLPPKWASQMRKALEKHRLEIKKPQNEFDANQHYVMACVLAMAAELTDEDTEQSKWLDESLSHLKRYRQLVPASTNWFRFDPSLRALRHHRLQELWNLVEQPSA